MLAFARQPRNLTHLRRGFGAAQSLRLKSSVAPNNPDDNVIELDDVKGPGWWWLLKLTKDPIKTRHELYDEIGRDQGVAYVRTAQGKKSLIVFNQDDIKHIYQNEGKDVTGSTGLWPLVKYFTDLSGDHEDNLSLNLTQSGDRWRKTRALLSPGIYSEAVAKYEPLVQEAAARAVDYVELYTDNMSGWCQYAAFDMFSSLALGKSKVTVDPDCNSPMKEVVNLDEKALNMAVVLHFLPKLFHPRNGYETFKGAFDQILAVTKDEVDALFSKETIPNCWFKDLRDEQGLTRDQIVQLMGPLLSAGIATTMGLMQWMIIALLFHPEAQTKLREEVMANLGRDKPFTKDVKMPYLDAFFRETNRFYPAAAGTGMRTLDHDLVLPYSRVRVPAGTMMEIAPIFAPRDTKHIPDADEFKPERYLRENIRARKGCPMGAMLDSVVSKDPFGNGARVCLGKRAAELELRTILCELVKRYELILDPPSQPRPLIQQRTVAVPKSFPSFKVRRLD